MVKETHEPDACQRPEELVRTLQGASQGAGRVPRTVERDGQEEPR